MLYLPAARGDERGFIHKRGSFFRKIGKKIVGGLPVVGGLVEGLAEGAGIFESEVDRFRKAREAGPGALTLFRKTAGCPPGLSRDASGNCVSTTELEAFRISRARGGVNGISATMAVTGAEGQLLPFGEAKMGRFGAGLKPAVFSQQRRACPRGSVLGAPEADGSSLCYNKRDISNKERAWPRGRRPLLTGGEMRAISTASAAAKKLQRKQKQLEQLGLLKKPAPRTRRALPAGHRAELVHSGS